MIRVSRLPVLLTVVVGTVVSLAAAAVSASWERRMDALAFQRLAEDQVSVINTDLKEATVLLDTIRAFPETTRSPATRQQFARFSASLHGRTFGLRDTGWAPHVLAAERAEFEHTVQESGFPDFRICDFNAAGKLVPAAERSEYFAIL